MQANLGLLIFSGVIYYTNKQGYLFYIVLKIKYCDLKKKKR